MNQNQAILLLAGGLATFLAGFGAELASAHSWTEVVAPSMVGKMLIQLGGVAASIYGALKVKTP